MKKETSLLRKLCRFISKYFIRKDDNAAVLEIARKISEDVDSFYKILEENYSSYDVGAKKVCATLFKQIRDLFQATLLLSQNDLVNEAKILVRSVIEISAYLLFISDDDQEERATLYMYSQNLSQKIAVDEFNSSVPPGEQKVDDRFYKKIEKEAFEYFRRKHGQDKSDADIRKKYTIKSRDVARQLKGDAKGTFDTLFTKYFRPVSALMHGQAPLQLVKMHENQLKLKNETSGIHVRVCLQSVSVLTFYAMENLNKFLEMNKDNIAATIDVRYIKK